MKKLRWYHKLLIAVAVISMIIICGELLRKVAVFINYVVWGS